VLVALVNEIAKKHKVKIIVFTSRDAFYSPNESVEVQYLSDGGRSFWDRAKQLVALRRILKREKTDVFISFLSLVNIAAVLLKPRYIPIIVSEHSQYLALASKFFRRFRRIVYPYADALTVLFPKDSEYYNGWGVNLEVMPNPCSFNAPKEEEKLEKDDLVVLAARLHENKNISMFLRVVSVLDDDLRRSCRFCVLGEGNLKDSLKQEAEALSVQVEFLGAVKNIEDYYKKAKIICLTSNVEGLPMVLIESLFFGVARISTKCSGGVQNLIDDGVDGFLVEKNDARAMSEKMALLMRDEDLRLRIVQQANKKREQFDVKNITKQWLDLIHKVIEQRGNNKV